MKYDTDVSGIYYIMKHIILKITFLPSTIQKIRVRKKLHGLSINLRVTVILDCLACVGEKGARYMKKFGLTGR